jgi:CHASE3 domain sensor protein
MTIEYYDKLQEVDERLEELVDLKDELYKRLVEERNQAVAKVIKEFDRKVQFLQSRFDQSAERVLAELGETIPSEIKEKIKNDK